MNVQAFLEWATRQTDRYELVGGRPVAMAPERAAHARRKAAVHRQLADAIADAGVPCEAFIDGMTVAIDDTTAYEPDVVVHCGPRVDDDALVVTRPVIVVEVLSPSTGGRDSGAKLDDYFQLPSVVHYLLVKTERRAVIHHQRVGDGSIATRIMNEGVIDLDPPGITLDVDALDG